VTTLISVGLPLPTPSGPGAPAGNVFGDLALGSISLLIVAACWLYARGYSGKRPFVYRRSLRILRAARAAREVLKGAWEVARERI
jgi:hypothetical protein